VPPSDSAQRWDELLTSLGAILPADAALVAVDGPPARVTAPLLTIACHRLMINRDRLNGSNVHHVVFHYFRRVHCFLLPGMLGIVQRNKEDHPSG